MTIYRGVVLDTPESPFTGGDLRVEADAGIAVTDGVITDRGPFAQVRAALPDADVIDLTGGVVLPGLVDTHVHFPQVRVIGALGMPLLDWLDRCALPEEARMADAGYARTVAAEFVDGLIRAGTTTALVFGAHFATAVDCLFERAAAGGLRVSAGLVVSDRLLRPELLTTPEQAHADGLALAGRWHRKDRLRYAAGVGCNQLVGVVEINGSAVKFGPAASTMMACPPPLDAWEKAIGGMLERAVSWRGGSETLELLDATGTIVMRLAAAPQN